MNYRHLAKTGLAIQLLALLAVMPAAAQVPVDEDGELIGAYEPRTTDDVTGNEDIPLLSTVDLEELVGPIALYPDDLLAIVLPASAYPLQIIEAARFLEALEDDPTLKPDPDWDDSVVALLNYPEVVELLNEDIDWTWRLGEAVVAQQADVVGAIETFRDRAYAAGNLKSDSYQNVTRDQGVIEITPISEDVIYVPYYEPERVVVYQPRPVYYYYPRAYPVYYYPYSSAYAFDRGYFWGVTTAFTIGWYSDSLNVFHHSYHGHPYYGRHYRDRWWYRRPSINIYNTTYTSRSRNVTVNRYYGGDRWRPRHNRRDYVRDVRVTRNRTNPNVRSNDTRVRRATNVTRDTTVTRASHERRSSNVRRSSPRVDRQERRNNNAEPREPISFRDRPQTVAMNRPTPRDAQSRNRGKRQYAARSSQPAPKVRQSTPRVRQATPTTEARRPATRSTQPRRSEPRRSEAPRRTEPRRSEAPRRTEPRRSEPQRQSETTKRSAERRPREESRAEPRRAKERKSEKRSSRGSEKKSRHRR